ncbi:MAG TPA: hypothetical protein VGQ46_02965 [Thermoanaerobaculia bacterium]|nr:hypothetical protein [Thermoanaerobaculia bacterium]
MERYRSGDGVRHRTIAGFNVRETAFGAAILLAMFGLAMAISEGVKSPLNYSVLPASAAAVLLGRASMKR